MNRFSINTGLFLAFATLIGTSCSSVNKIALRSTSDILQKGSEKILEEPNWHLFKEGAPGNIMMLEGMSHSDPENTTLLAMLAKAYGGYAFGVHETLYLDDYLGDRDTSFNKGQAISAYTKGLEYGLRYLEQKGIDREVVYSKDAATKLPKLMDGELDDGDMVAVFYTAQSLGGLINLQKDNVTLISRIGSVKAMMDWVCNRDMDFELGGCHLFYAMFEASRPAMLGGDLEKGKALFEKHIKKYPYNLLGRITFIQYYVIPMIDDVEYAKQREFLARELGEWRNVKNAGVSDKQVEEYRKRPEYNLYNSIADERFKIIERNKDNIF